MADLTDDMIDAALERGRLAQARECRAAKATYDRHSRHVVVELTNGCVFSFPSGLVEALRAVDDDQIAPSKFSDKDTVCTGRRWIWTCR